MLNFGNKEFRNLQEQVLYLSNRSNFGLNIKGEVASVPALGDIPNTTIGDVYLVGDKAPFNFFIKTADKTWTNLGKLESNVPGPQGEQGIQGLKGADGTVIYVNNEPEAANDGDLFINSNGMLTRYELGQWTPVVNLKGPAGPVGPKGPKGDKGDKGDTGPRGAQGEQGLGVVLGGAPLTSADLLPSKPVSGTNAYLVGTKPPYQLYVWSGTGWTQAGTFATLDNINVIILTVPETATNGTLSASQLLVLKNSRSALIQLGDYIYRKEAVTGGKMIYKSITDDLIKVISINESGGSWVKVEYPVNVPWTVDQIPDDSLFPEAMSNYTDYEFTGGGINKFSTNSLVAGWMEKGVIGGQDTGWKHIKITVVKGTIIRYARVDQKTHPVIEAIDGNGKLIESVYCQTYEMRPGEYVAPTNCNIYYNVTPSLDYKNQFLVVIPPNRQLARDRVWQDVFHMGKLKSGYIGNDGKVNPTSAFFHVEVPLKPFDEILVAYQKEQPLSAGALYDANGNYLCNVWPNAEFARPLHYNPENAGSLAFVNTIGAAMFKYNYLPDPEFPNASQYILKRKGAIYPISKNNPNTWYVNGWMEQSRGRTFKTIKECSEYIMKNNIQNAHIIVLPYTYDLIAEHGGAAALDALGNYQGIMFGNNTHWDFRPGAKIVARYNGTNAHTAGYFSAINIAGSCTIEGANITVQNCRYCVHDDLPSGGASNLPEGAHVKYINCVMNHEPHTFKADYEATICIGGGTYGCSRHEIIGGRYKCPTTPRNYPISYHNSGRAADLDVVVIKDVYFENGSVRCFDLSASKLDMYVSNCSCGTIAPFSETMGGQNTHLYAWNNEIRQ